MVFLTVLSVVSSVCLTSFVVVRALNGRQLSSLPLLSMDEIRNIAEHCDPVTATHLGCVNMSLRRVSPLRLNRKSSAEYIRDPLFRARVNATRNSPRDHIWLNLGEDFWFYIVYSDFRAMVDDLVRDPTTQVWSDVKKLNLFCMAVEDISPLARLPKLQELNLGRSLVRNLYPLARLTSLRILYLDNAQVPSLTALAGLTNLRVLTVMGTVVDLDELAHLTDLFIIQ